MLPAVAGIGSLTGSVITGHQFCLNQLADQSKSQNQFEHVSAVAHYLNALCNLTVIFTSKGQSSDISCLWFFKDWALPKPLTRYVKAFRICLRISRRYYRFLIDSLYSGQPLLPVLFSTESCDSPHHSLWRVKNVCIMCRNSGLSFNTVSRTPHIV